jgi:type VI secretion system protein ImpH
MAPENGRKSAGLSDHLLREPYRFDFFQAVRLLERMAYERAEEDPAGQRFPVGQDRAPEKEVVRFRAHASLSFPAASISGIRLPAPRPGSEREVPPPEMTVSFLSLTGANGVLPYHYTALMLRRFREKDYSVRDFLDLFNHRLVSLFFRAWEKYRLPIAYERSRLEKSAPGTDAISQLLYCLVGLGTTGLRGRLGISDQTVVHYAGHFARYPRSAIGLELMLQDYFKLPILVLQMFGQWLTLGQDDVSVMPGPDAPQGRNNELGVSLVVGERVYDVQSKFRLRVGPLRYPQFRRLLPTGDRLRPLCQLTSLFVGPELDFDVQLVLEAADVPWCRLDAEGEAPPYLGLNTWVRCEAFTRDTEDTVFFLDRP